MATEEVEDLRKRSVTGPLQIQCDGHPKTRTVTIQFGAPVTFLELPVHEAQMLSGMINEAAKKADRDLKGH